MKARLPATAQQEIESLKDFLFIDMRTLEDHETLRPKNSIFMSLKELGNLHQVMPNTPQTTPIYLLCYLGNTSMIAARKLTVLGYENVFSIEGGFKAWEQEDLPIECFGETINHEEEVDFSSRDTYDLLKRVSDTKKNADFKSPEEQIQSLELELMVEKNKAALNSQLAMLGEMSTEIFHEINNPLAIVQGHLGILTQTLAKALHEAKSKEGKAQFEQTEKSALALNSAMTRINHILKTVRSVGYNPNLEKKEFLKIENFLNEVIELSKIKNKEIPVSYKLTESCRGIRFQAHKNQIIQVMINLINNAFDALSETDQKNSWVKINCHFSEPEEGSRQLFFSITDSGSGIPKKIQEQIMTSFFTTKPKGKGTGLGMGVIRDIIENHQGQFFIDNSSENTCFVFSVEW